MSGTPRLYRDLASWWPLFSPPAHYAEEAVHLLGLLAPAGGGRQTLLELGSGAGSLASHLRPHFDLTLTDLSADMLEQSRRVNPGVEHLQGDMRTLDLGRRFDRVLVHDAVMYAVTEADLLATLATASRHCRPDGRVVVVPDYVAETFTAGISTGGEDGADGRGLRYLEWMWDPDPSDTEIAVAFAFLLRDAGGVVTVEADHHRCGIFPRDTWFRLFDRAGLLASAVPDPWRQDVFVARAAAGRGP
jgi:hypothetical protein